MSIYKQYFYIYLAIFMVGGAVLFMMPLGLGLNLESMDPSNSGSSLVSNEPLAPDYIPFAGLLIIVFTTAPYLVGSIYIPVLVNLMFPPHAALLQQAARLLNTGIYITALFRSLFLLYMVTYPEHMELRQEAVRLQGLCFQFTILQSNGFFMVIAVAGLYYRVLPRWVSWPMLTSSAISIFFIFLCFNPNIPHLIRSNAGFAFQGISAFILGSYLYLLDKAIQGGIPAEKTLTVTPS